VTAVPAAPVSMQPGMELAAATPAIHHLADSDGDEWCFGCLKPFYFSLLLVTAWNVPANPWGQFWKVGVSEDLFLNGSSS